MSLKSLFAKSLLGGSPGERDAVDCGRLAAELVDGNERGMRRVFEKVCSVAHLSMESRLVLLDAVFAREVCEDVADHAEWCELGRDKALSDVYWK